MTSFPRKVQGTGTTKEDVVTRRPLRFVRGEYGLFREEMREVMQERFAGWFPGQGDIADALIDATAVVADQLAFYNDVFGAEAFLPTANDERSVLCHIAVLPFRPHPGAAAQAWVLFNLKEDKADSLPAGTGIQGDGPDGKVTFETHDDLDASWEMNELAAATESVRFRWEAGSDADLDDGVLAETSFLIAERSALVPGDRLLARAPGSSFARFTVTAEPEEVERGFLVPVDASVPAAFGDVDAADLELYRLREPRQRLFGTGTSIPAAATVDTFEAPFDIVSSGDVTATLRLEATIDGATGDLLLLTGRFTIAGETPVSYAVASLIEVDTAEQENARIEWTETFDVIETSVVGDDVEFSEGTDDVTTLHQREVTLIEGTVDDGTDPLPPPDALAWTDLQQLRAGDALRARHIPQADRLSLVDGFERGYLPQDLGTTLPLDVDALPDLMVRGRRIWVQGEDGGCIARVLSADTTTHELTLDASVADAVGRVVSVHGNVVLASHGETQSDQKLGSGNAQLASQSFGLPKTPLTHLADPDAELGVAPQLEVRVDGVRWHAVEEFADSGPLDRVYRIEAGEEDEVALVFGDGERGARLPTGKTNVRAEFRVGQGDGGNVDAEALTKAKGVGALVDSVRNPEAASGGEDPENPLEVRSKIPRAMRALDRAISIDDVQVLVERFPGVLRVWVSLDSDTGVIQVIVLPTGDRDLGDELAASVLAYIEARSLPGMVFSVLSVREKQVDLDIKICSDPDYDTIDVENAIVAALSSDGGFFDPELRGIGQSLYRSDLAAAVAAVPGVVSIERLELSVTGETAGAVDWVLSESREIILWSADPAEGAEVSGIEVVSDD